MAYGHNTPKQKHTPRPSRCFNEKKVFESGSCNFFFQFFCRFFCHFPGSISSALRSLAGRQARREKLDKLLQRYDDVLAMEIPEEEVV